MIHDPCVSPGTELEQLHLKSSRLEREIGVALFSPMQADRQRGASSSADLLPRRASPQRGVKR